HEEPLEKPHGAFFAIRNFHDKPVARPETLADIRKPYFSEMELSFAQSRLAECDGERARYKAQLSQTQNQLAEIQAQLSQTQTQLADSNFKLSQTRADAAEAMHVAKHPVVRAQRRIWRMIRRQWL
ncbi:hypothetical protein LDC_2590, partial [sediment metagenome]